MEREIEKSGGVKCKAEEVMERIGNGTKWERETDGEEIGR